MVLKKKDVFDKGVGGGGLNRTNLLYLSRQKNGTSYDASEYRNGAEIKLWKHVAKI